jgi:hypothetical protein
MTWNDNTRHAMAWYEKVRHGMACKGMSWKGKARKERHGKA